MKRRLKFLLKVFLAIVVLFFLFLVLERVRGKISLASCKRGLIAKGKKLAPSDFVSRSNDAENGAPQVFEGVRRLAQGLVLPTHYPPRMQVVPSGRAVVGFREDEWVESNVTNHWGLLAAA